MKLFTDFGTSKVYENVSLIKPILLKRDIKHKKCFFIVATRYRNKERTADFNQIVKIHSYQISTFLNHTYYTVYAGVFFAHHKICENGENE